MTYSGQKIWELNEAEVWRFYLIPIIKTIDSALKIFEEEDVERLIIYDNTSIYQKTFELVAKNLEIEVIDKTPAKTKIENSLERTAINVITKKSGDTLLDLLKPEAKDKPKSTKKKIVIFYDHCTLRNVLPWASQISENHDKICVGIDSKEKVEEEIKKAGMPYEKLQNYATEETIQKLKQIKEKLADINEKAKLSNFKYRGIDLWPISKKMFSFLFNERFLETYIRIETFNKMLEYEKPDLVITVDDWSRYPNTLLKICKQKQIKTLAVRYGVYSQVPKGYEITADRVLVYGEESKKILTMYGQNIGKAEVTGQADADGTANAQKEIEMFEKLGIDKNKKLIVFAGTCVPENGTYHPYDIFYKTIKKYPEEQIIVKTHPAETPYLHEKFIKKYSIKNVKITNDYLFELLKNCDMIINLTSTVATEAMTYGKKIIHINTLKAPDYSFPPENENYLKLVSTEEELDKTLKTFLEQPNEDKEEIIEVSKQTIKEKGEPVYAAIVKNIEEMLDTTQIT
jgi:hypothetical protein